MNDECRGQTALHVHYLGHSAWLVSSPQQYWLFDYGRLPQRLEGTGLQQGVISPALLADRPLMAFFSHVHQDHFDGALADRLSSLPRAEVFTGLSAGQAAPHPGAGANRAHMHLLRPHQVWRQTPGQDMTVLASGSTDQGVSCLVIAASVVIYHGGDLAAWDTEYQSGYRAEVDWLHSQLATFGRQIDLAFLPVSTSDGYQEDPLLDGLDRFISLFRPRHIFPMHAHGYEALYPLFADRASRLFPGLDIHVPCQPGDSFAIDTI